MARIMSRMLRRAHEANVQLGARVLVEEEIEERLQ
jgi:hypothetical protein